MAIFCLRRLLKRTVKSRRLATQRALIFKKTTASRKGCLDCSYRFVNCDFRDREHDKGSHKRDAQSVSWTLCAQTRTLLAFTAKHRFRRQQNFCLLNRGRNLKNLRRVLFTKSSLFLKTFVCRYVIYLRHTPLDRLLIQARVFTMCAFI